MDRELEKRNREEMEARLPQADDEGDEEDDSLKAKLRQVEDPGLRDADARGSKAVPSPPYDCDAGYVKWEETWATDKKDWCCRRERRGCRLLPSEDVPSWGGSRTTW